MVRYRSTLVKTHFNNFNKKNSLRKYKVSLNLNRRIKVKLKKLYTKYSKIYSNYLNLRVSKLTKQLIRASKKEFFESFKSWNLVHNHNPKFLKSKNFKFYLVRNRILNLFLLYPSYSKNFSKTSLNFLLSNSNKYKYAYYNKQMIRLRYVKLNFNFNFNIVLSVLKNFYMITCFTLLNNLKIK